ncbi:hypothetical protein NEF87_004493 [Candidatus Lokiarchaeum ossiferum]|uniref:SIR2-like domain-containing protein n=1 Tax=Candidatus Lokiarchaeum ossiferum TaxID=2951803 RepID=A0ABY6HXF0_9ARCH|nr:hypothetical protein NEF87_004493 [Candidatus Lokiarchaeum sp. B-35]
MTQSGVKGNSTASPTQLISELFHPEGNYTFLVGAGISMNAPANIPSAVQFVKSILELCAPQEEIDSILSLQYLRYELLIEKFKIYLDTNLHFLDYLEFATQPNLLHLFLASALLHKQYLVTTNFDFMLERALQAILLPTEEYKIVPVITKADFGRDFRPYDLVEQGLCPIYKIHGSKKNIITGEDTAGSLITTMGSLGRDRAIGETFTLEEYKQQPFYNLVKGRTLIVMGYSGSDDFDIGPMLMNLPTIENLVWIDHSSDKHWKINCIAPVSTSNSFKNPSSKTSQLLHNIASNINISVYHVLADTHDFVKTVLWPKMMPNFPLVSEEILQNTTKLPDFNQWIQQEFQNDLPTMVKKWQFACSLYADFNQWKALGRCAKNGLEESQKINDPLSQTLFLNYLGKAQAKQLKLYSAMQHFQEGLDIAEKTDQFEYMATFINNVGVISSYLQYVMDSSQKEATLEMFENALTVFEQHQNQWGKIATLTNIAGIEFFQGNYLESNKNLMESYTQTQHLGNLAFKSVICYDLAIICEFLMSEKDVLNNYHEGISINHQMGDVIGELNGHFQLLQYWFIKGDYKQAKSAFLQALSLGSKCKNESLIADLYSWKAWVDYKTNNLGSAIQNMQKTFQMYESLQKIDLVRLWQAQSLSDLGYFEFGQNQPEKALTHWKQALALIEEKNLHSPYIEIISKQLNGNIKIAQDEIRVLPSLDNILPYISDLTHHLNSLDDKIKFLEKAIASEFKSIDLPPFEDPFQGKVYAKIDALFDLGYLFLTNRDSIRSTEKFELAIDLISRLEQYSMLERHFENFAHLGIIWKNIRAYRTQYFFLTQDDFDLTQENLSWMASWHSRSKSKDAFKFMHQAQDCFNDEKYTEAIELFSKAKDIFEKLGETRQVQEIQETIDTVLVLNAVENKNLKEEMTKDPESTLKVLQTLQKMKLRGKSNSTEEEDSESIKIAEDNQDDSFSSLNGVFNRDLVSSTQFLITLEDKGRNIDFVQDHDDEFFNTLSKLDMALKMSESMDANQPLEKVDLLVFMGQYLAQNKEFTMAQERLEEAYHISKVYGREAKSYLADICKGFGNLYYHQEKWDESLRYFEQSVRLYETLHKLKDAAICLNMLGVVNLKIQDNQRALFYFEQVQKFPINEENAEKVAENLVRAAEQHEFFGHFQQSLSFLLQSQQIYESYQIESNILAPTYLKIAQLYFLVGHFDKALPYYENALKQYQLSGDTHYITVLPKKIEELQNKQPDQEVRLKAFFHKAEAMWGSDEPLSDLLKAYQKVLFIESFIPNIEIKAKTYYNLGVIYSILGDPYHTRTNLEKFFQLLDSIPSDPPLEELKSDATTKLNLVKAIPDSIEFYENQLEDLLTEENYIQVGKVYRHLLRFFNLNRDYGKLSLALYNFAQITFTNLNNFNEAMLLFKFSADVFAQLGDEQKRNEIWKELSSQYFTHEQKEKSVEFCLKLVDYYKDHPNETELCKMANFTGNIYSDLRKYELASNYKEIALNCCKSLELPDEKLDILIGLGFVQEQQANLDAALQAYQEGLHYAIDQQHSVYIQAFNINLAEINYFQGNFPKAEEFSQKAVELFDTVQIGDYLAVAHSRLGDLHFDQNEIEKAQEYYAKACDFHQQQGNQVDFWNTQLKYDFCKYKIDPTEFSIEVFDERVKECEPFENSDTKIEIYMTIAKICVSQQKFEKAQTFFTLGLSLSELLANALFTAFILYLWGKMEFLSLDKPVGIEKLTLAKDKFKRINNPEIEQDIQKLLEN